MRAKLFQVTDMAKKTVKKVLVVSGIILLVLCAAGYMVYRKPSVQFMLAMVDVIQPGGVDSREVSIDINGTAMPMMVYEKRGAKSERYYFFLHGVTPQSYRHPTMRKLAAAIAGATGRTVLVPHIHGSETGRTIENVTGDIAKIYTELRGRYKGPFNAFGACVAGTGLLLAFNNVPGELYPEKIFMYGPFLNGRILADFYNSSKMNVDYIVKMTNAMRSRAVGDGEKELISRAILATKPGTTDRDEMMRILGDNLFRKVDELRIDNQEFTSINEYTLFPAGKPLPRCSYYTIHSRSDNIIPYSMGMGLHRFLMQRGLKSRFVSTGAFQHTSAEASVATLARELRDLVAFLDELFGESAAP